MAFYKPKLHYNKENLTRSKALHAYIIWKRAWKKKTIRAYRHLKRNQSYMPNANDIEKGLWTYIGENLVILKVTKSFWQYDISLSLSLSLSLSIYIYIYQTAIKCRWAPILISSFIFLMNSSNFLFNSSVLWNSSFTAAAASSSSPSVLNTTPFSSSSIPSSSAGKASLSLSS